MKNSKPLLAKIVSAIGALTCGAALAQTNTLPSTYALSVSLANTNQPGFIWNVSQVSTTEPNLLSFAESQLAGVKGINLADPNAFSTAVGPATVGSDPTAPISFVIPGFINFSIAGPGDAGHARPDLAPEDAMPGLPGSGGTANIAAEALTYLQLTAGSVTMGVRSDDGFRLLIGAANPADRYSTNAINVGEFNGGRGAADNFMTLIVPKTGLYAARLLYENGGGDANVEWYSFPGTNAALLTNAVLINDVANGGIPAYSAVTTPAGSYISSLLPPPGATGVSPVPIVTAKIINGAVPVTGVTLTLNGTVVNASVTNSTNGATVSFTVPNFLPPASLNKLSLSWVDNGTPLNLTWTFTTSGYVLVSAAQAVTPDTAKPGFLFNIFENSTDQNAVDNDNYDNAELGLNGLLPAAGSGLENGGVLTEPGLVNNITITNTAGVATGPAPALTDPAAPAKFQIATALNLTNGLPGLPATDGSQGPSHSEVLTYVQLPVGLTTFNLNVDGFYRAFVGSWDYTVGVQAGTVNAAQKGVVQFFIYASVAGYYPLRLTYINKDGTPALALSTLGANGTNVLVGDTAHGGLAAYRALTTPAGPYVRYTSPRNVPRQVAVPSPSVFIRIQDGATSVNDTSPVLNLDGKAVPLSTNRVGDVLELTFAPTNLITAGEIHSASLTYKDTAGKLMSNQWSFLNLKATWLPANAVDVETFDQYPEPTFFTNTPPGTNWYVWNYDAPSGSLTNDITNPNSDTYLNFVVVSAATFANIEGDSASIAPFEMLNGQPITTLTSGNILIAESDNRAGSSPGQVQFAVSRSFNLSGVTNPVLAFASIYKQNQDNLGAMEYSVDGQKTWLPVIYYLDGGDVGSDPADLIVNFDGTVNVALSLTNSSDPPHWTSGGVLHTTYGDGIAAPITPALAPFFAPRINDDKSEGKRLETIRLPLAAGKSDVRLRLCQLGTCSWYFGVDNIAFYDIPLSGATVPTGVSTGPGAGPGSISAQQSGNNVLLSWTAASNVQLQQNFVLGTTNWVTVAGTLGAGGYTNAIAHTNVFYRLIQH